MKLVLLTIGLFLSSFAYSQTTEKFSATAGIETFIPLSGIENNILKDNYYGGIGQNIQLEYQAGKVVTTTLSTGYYYTLGKSNQPALTQYPALFGLKFHFTSTISFLQTGGVSFVNQGYGFKFMYTSGLVLEYERIVADAKFISTIADNHQATISGVALRLGYRF